MEKIVIVKKKSSSGYITDLVKLTFPMAMGNLSFILISFGSIFVAARYSTQVLAAMGLSNSFTSCVFMLGNGILSGIAPLLANKRGKKEQSKKFFLPTIIFSMALALLSVILIFAILPLINIIGFEPRLTAIIKQYMIIMAFSGFGGYLYTGLKEYLQSFEIVFFPNFLNIISIFLNLVLAFVFAFGWHGIPAFGGVGIALASLILKTFQGLSLLIFCLIFFNMKKYQELNYIKNVFKLGFPIAIVFLFESLAFNVIMIILGKISGNYAAAQNIILTIISAFLMVPIAISNAISVKVGFFNGARNSSLVKSYAVAGILISIIFTLFSSILLISFPEIFIKIFTKDINLLNICLPIMPLVAFFSNLKWDSICF